MKIPSVPDRYLLLVLLVVVLALGALVARQFRPATAPPVTPAPVQEKPQQMLEVILYFATEDGRYLATEEREIENCSDEEACLRATVQALLRGPSGELVPVLPAQAALRAISVEDGTAIVDFSNELVVAHPGGSMSELFSVYALANTLAVNFPHIRQVRILVEGEEVETLKGHVDLRSPVSADFNFARPPEERLPEATENLQFPAEKRH